MAKAITSEGWVTGGLYPPFPNFTIYTFETDLPISEGVSSFTVEVIHSGKRAVHDNEGHEFPFSDAFQPQISRSLVTRGTGPGPVFLELNLTVAVGLIPSAQIMAIT
jgi:hypothetical protein